MWFALIIIRVIKQEEGRRNSIHGIFVAFMLMELNCSNHSWIPCSNLCVLLFEFGARCITSNYTIEATFLNSKSSELQIESISTHTKALRLELYYNLWLVSNLLGGFFFLFFLKHALISILILLFACNEKHEGVVQSWKGHMKYAYEFIRDMITTSLLQGFVDR